MSQYFAVLHLEGDGDHDYGLPGLPVTTTDFDAVLTNVRMTLSGSFFCFS